MYERIKTMEIGKKQFAREMAKNGDKTICSCEDYLELAMDTFFKLLKEGKIIHFQGLFKTDSIDFKGRKVWNLAKEEIGYMPPQKQLKIRISPVAQKQFIEECCEDNQE